MKHLYVLQKFVFLSVILLALAGCNGNSTSDLGNTSGVVLTPSDPEPIPSTPSDPSELRSATILWSPPLEKENGEPLTPDELSGFQIYYGSVDNPYENVVSIDSPYTTSYIISGLPVGEYSFSIVAVDATGRTSTFSNTVVKSIS